MPSTWRWRWARIWVFWSTATAPSRRTWSWRGAATGRGFRYPELGIALEDLNGNFHSGVLEARLGVLQRGATSGAETMSHVGEEFCYVVDGTIRYTIDGESFTLETGDSLHFHSELAHRWENREDGVTTVAWVFSDGLSF